MIYNSKNLKDLPSQEKLCVWWMLKLPKDDKVNVFFCVWGLMVIFPCLARGYVLFSHQKRRRTGAYWCGEISQEIHVYSECKSPIYTVFIIDSRWHCVWVIFAHMTQSHEEVSSVYKHTDVTVMLQKLINLQDGKWDLGLNRSTVAATLFI